MLYEGLNEKIAKIVPRVRAAMSYVELWLEMKNISLNAKVVQIFR